MNKNISDIRAAQYTPQAFLQGMRTAIRRAYGESDLSVGLDSAALDSLTAVALRNVEQVIARELETIYPPLKADMVVPMGTEGVMPYADEFIYQRWTDVGLADYVINGEMPRMDVSLEETRVKVHTLGGEVGWDVFDLERARAGGVPLDTAKFRARERGAATSRNLIMLSGDSGLPKGGGLISTGFVNDPNVSAISTTTGAWSGLTGDQLISDMSGYFSTFNSNVKQAFDPDTIALPSNRYYRLDRPLNTGTSVSLRKYLLDTFPFITRIEKLDELNTAGAGSGTRMVIYRRAPDVLVGVVPMSFRPFAPQQRGMNVIAQAAERLAGLVVKFPLGMLYVDGI